MLISVVIGALNEEKYIGRTIKTVNAQKTVHDFEVIVGDGFSSDRTVEIAEKMGAKVVLEKNRSAAWERQAGYKVARGHIVAFTDADAELPEDWLQKILEEFAKDDKTVMVYGPVYFSDAGPFQKLLSELLMPLFMAFMALLGMHNPIGSNIAVKRELFEQAGGFDTGLVTCEDLDLAKRMKRLGKVRFSLRAGLYVSARRVKKWGYLYFLFFHLVNGLRFQFTGKANRKYDVVR